MSAPAASGRPSVLSGLVLEAASKQPYEPEGPDGPSARTSSIRWLRATLQGQRQGVALTTRSGKPFACSTGSGICVWRGPNRCGRAPGRKSQTNARAPGRSTRPISASPAVGSAQWCIEKVLTARSNDPSGKASEAATPTRNDGRRSSPFPSRSRPGRAGEPDGSTSGQARNPLQAPVRRRGQPPRHRRQCHRKASRAGAGYMRRRWQHRR